MRNLIIKYKELLLYLFFGVMTTLVNFIVYFVCRSLFSIEYQVSIVLAWLLSVLFAFYTNKYFVFQEKQPKNKWIEMFRFYSSRVATLGIELILMLLLIDYLNVSEVFSKVFVQIVIIVLNYILSKLFVFRNKTK